MAKARVMDTKADFEKLGIDPTKVQTWEDGRRDTDEAGHNEVWYFDGILDDGGKFMVAFRPKSPYKLNEAGDEPNTNIMITTPNGETKQDFQSYSSEEAYIGNDKCDLKFGPHTAVGDFKNYDVHFEPVNGVGLDLHFEALVDPFRQGNSAVVALGDNDEYHYTYLNVPKNKVTGTLIYDGEKHEVTGLGYHDHQWMNIHPMNAWHHWLWGHLYTDKYTVMIYDFVSNERFGFERVPFFGIEDNETGHVVYMTDGNVTLDSELTTNSTGKAFPKTSKYTFQNEGDNKKVIFTVKWRDEIEIRDMYGDANEQQKAGYDQMGINPVYMRYYADGDVKIIDGDEVDQSSGDMIYEYNYLGKEDERADV